MTRRAGRHRYAILGVLDEYGPLTQRELRYELRRRSIRSRPLNRDLFALVLATRVVCYADPETYGQHLYRLATPTERTEARQIDAWLRTHLRTIPIGSEPPF